MKKIRLVGVTVAPQLVVDDGENLTALQVQPIAVDAKDWPGIVARLEEAITGLDPENPSSP